MVAEENKRNSTRIQPEADRDTDPPEADKLNGFTLIKHRSNLYQQTVRLAE